MRAPEGTEIVTCARRAASASLVGKVDVPNAPTILFFFGNGMSLAGALAEFHDLRRLGANVLIPEYVGYGMSSGSPSEALMMFSAFTSLADVGRVHFPFLAR